MPIKRIINQFNLRQSDKIILVYGHVNDVFVTNDLTLYNNDGIERLLHQYLFDNGFEQVIFYAPERQLYAYDETSRNHCFPQESPGTEENQQNQTDRSSNDGRPLARRKMLRNTAERSTLATSNAKKNTVTWHQENFIAIIAGNSDVAISDVIRKSMMQQSHKCAVIFSQFDDAGNASELQRIIKPLLGRFQRTNSQNKVFLISNALNQEKLNEVVGELPALSKIISLNEASSGLDSIIYIDYPYKDEIRNYFNRLRIVNEIATDWLDFDRIITHLNRERNQLKRWDTNFRDLDKIGVEQINQQLTNGQISKDHQSGLVKLEQLVGLRKAKIAIKRHLLQIKDLREQNPNEIPLMHICLKGNPGTGKTTIARLIADIFREANLLERGHLVEVDRQGLVAGYIGQTAIRTDQKCREALDGVLFVDEAYALSPTSSDSASDSSQDFGKEAVDTLIKRMSDWQNNFCVILAGYPDDMDRLLEINSGFQGRIGLTITIDDYEPDELVQLFKFKANGINRALAPDFEVGLLNLFTELYRRRGKKFDNARRVEILFGEVRSLHLERCLLNELDRNTEPFRLNDIPTRFKNVAVVKRVKLSAMERLTEMIGLSKAKAQISKQLAMIDAGYSAGNRLHLVFKGNPGTGKTTVARLVGEIYQDHQILSNNVFIEAGRQDLVGSVQGETAKKVTALCKQADGGVLFIDEAYAIINGDNDTFGKEAVDTLLKIAEDRKDDFCVILAGYPDEMDDFLRTNPGLTRRFPTHIEFEDYDPEELLAIFNKVITGKKLLLSDELKKTIPLVLEAIHRRKDEHFGNAGEVENLIQQLLGNHAIRCMNNKLSAQETPIILADVDEKIISLLPVANSDQVIDEALYELNQLTGLTEVKDKIAKLVRQYKHEQVRLLRNPKLANSKRSYHMVFNGNPGTGKTTVARILGKIFKALDILKTDKVNEVSRNDFVGVHLGTTAVKSKELIRKSFDQLLFIDEAYLLTNSMDSYGSEAIGVLLKMMEDHRDRLVVIAAGYPREMRLFLASNSGLSSRFTNVKFKDYSEKERVEIFKNHVRKEDYQIGDHFDNEIRIALNYHRAILKANYGNARSIIQFFNDDVLTRYYDRVGNLPREHEDYWRILKEDIPTYADERAEQEGNRSTLDEENFRLKQELNEQKNQTAKVKSVPSNIGGDYVVGQKTVTNNNYYGTEEVELPFLLSDVSGKSDEKVLGRENECSVIHAKLFDAESANQVLVYGLPGIGKSSTIADYVERYRESYDHLIWLDITASITRAFIENTKLPRYLGVDYQENEEESDRFKKLLFEIEEVPGKKLLVLDNLSVANLREIDQLDFSFLKTILIAEESIGLASELPINALDTQLAFQLFISNQRHQEISREELSPLLNIVSNHPYAIKLLAKILDERVDLNVQALTDKLRNGMHISTGTGSKEEIIDVFKNLFAFWELSDLDRKYLACFSLMPAYALPFELLMELFTDQGDSEKEELAQSISRLEKRGILYREGERHIGCHGIIQRVYRQNNELEQDMANLLNSLGTKLGDKIDAALVSSGAYTLLSTYLPILELFVNNYRNKEELSTHRIFINLSVFYRVNGQFQESIEIALEEKKILEARKEEFPHWYGILHRNISFAHAMDGNYLEAEKVLEPIVTFLEAVVRQRSSYDPDVERELFLTYLQLGELQLRPERYSVERAASFYEKGDKLIRKSSNPPRVAVAAVKEGLALIKIELNEYVEAIDLLKEVIDIMTNDLKLNPGSIAIGSLKCTLASAYTGANNYISAQAELDRGTSILMKHLPEDDLQFIRIYSIKSITLINELLSFKENGEFDLEIHEAAVATAKENALNAIDLMIKHRGVDHPDLAMLYGNYGLVLKLEGKEKEGYDQNIKGIEILKKANVKNELLVGLYVRTYVFFEDQTTETLAEEGLVLCLEIIPKSHDRLMDRGYIHYCLGCLRHEMGESRKGIDEIYKALKLVREYIGKGNSEVENPEDSPVEVFCLSELATIYSAMDEHKNAIEAQEEAIEICAANIREDDEDFADFYLGMCKIYLKAAEKLGTLAYFANALEYKVKLNKSNPDKIKTEKDLVNIAQPYIILDQEDNKRRRCVIVPFVYQEEFLALMGTSNDSTKINKVGYLVPVKKQERTEHMVDRISEKYGSVNMDLASS